MLLSKRRSRSNTAIQKTRSSTMHRLEHVIDQTAQVKNEIDDEVDPTKLAGLHPNACRGEGAQKHPEGVEATLPPEARR